jgi:4-hydroxybenzoate polyprenyltransferase
MLPKRIQSLEVVETPPVLCIDLDGTLHATDILWESIVVLVKQQPLFVLLLPVWLLQGRAALKREVAQRVKLDVASLPYREDVLAFLKNEKKAGRELVMATGADAETANRVAQYLGIFSDVIASDGKQNLAGAQKREALERRFGFQGFDYVGNSRKDLSVWSASRGAILVAPSKRTLNKASGIADVRQVFSVGHNRLIHLLKALRCYQWLKNLLLLVPIMMAHKLTDVAILGRGLWAFWAFSLCASGLYILNDLADLASDRRHPQKRFRPFAAGTISIPGGFLLSCGLLICGFAVAISRLPLLFVAGLVLYAVTTGTYSLYIKRVAVSDILTLAGLYTLRVLLGGVATEITISTWLLAFSMFLFLCLAFVKRYAELSVLQLASDEQQVPGRGYIRNDKEWMANMGSASGYLSVLVLALYINSQDVVALYAHPSVLWLVCPAWLYWITRLWFLTYRGHMHDDPILFAIKDRVSYVIGISILVIMMAAI